MTEAEWQPARWEFPSGNGVEEVPGLYRVQSDGAAEARVHGTVGDSPGMAQDLFEHPPALLHGVLMNSVVTLVDSAGLRSSSGLRPIQDVTLEPRYAIEGEQVEAEHLALTKAEIVFTNQDEWTGWSVYEEVSAEEYADGLRIRFVKPPEYQAERPGGTIRLIDASSPSVSAWPHERVFRSASRFMLDFDQPTAIDEIFDQWIPPLLLLLSSASGQAVGIKSLHGTNGAWPLRGQVNPTTKWVNIRVSRPDAPKRPRSEYDYFHRLEDFDYERQIPLLFDAVSRCRYAAYRTLSLWEQASPSHVEDFVRTLQVTEALGRALHPMIDNAPAILVYLNRDTGQIINNIWGNGGWIDCVRILRDVATHSFQTANEFLGDVRALQGATEILTILLQASWLVAMGFSAEQARDLVERRPQYGWQANLIRNTKPLMRAVRKK